MLGNCRIFIGRINRRWGGKLNKMDYVIPDKLAKMLRKPSPRTQMESSLIGIMVMMLGSLCVTSYMIINGLVEGFWFKFLIIASELGILSFQWGLLSTTYQQYYNYKLENDMYPMDYKLKICTEEAKIINEKLDSTIKQVEKNKFKKV